MESPSLEVFTEICLDVAFGNMCRDDYCGAGLTFGLNVLESLLQPWWFCDSVTLRTMLRLCLLFFLCICICAMQALDVVASRPVSSAGKYHTHTSPPSQALLMSPSKSALKPPLQGWQACWLRHSCRTFTTTSPPSFQPLFECISVKTYSSVLRQDCVFCLLTHLCISYSQPEKDRHWGSSNSCARSCAEEPGNSWCSRWQKLLLKCRGKGEKGLWDITKPSRVIVYH